MCTARSAAGLAAGFLCAIYSAFLANTKSPGKVIAVTTFIQIGIEALFVFCATAVFRWLGSTGFIPLDDRIIGTACSMARCPPAWLSTSRRHLHSPPNRATSTVDWLSAAAGLHSIHHGANGRVHVLGRVRRLAANLSPEQTLRSVGMAVVFSSLGSVGAYLLNDRAGFLLPIGIAILMTGGMMFAVIFVSRSAALFLFNISLLQIAWIFLGCYLYSALIHFNNLLVPAATSLSSFGSAFGASAVGLVLEHGGLTGTLILTTGALSLTALLTLPFLSRARYADGAAAPAQPAASAASIRSN